jgi:hypothetical protein
VFTAIGKIVAKAYGAVSFVVGIGKQMVPFVRAARELSPDLDRVVDRIEAQVTAGGDAADDWIDRNVEAVRALDNFFSELVVAGQAGREVTALALRFSQAETPDTITPRETETLVLAVAALRAALADLGTADDLEKMLAGL